MQKKKKKKGIVLRFPFKAVSNKETQFAKGGFAYTPKTKKDFMLKIVSYIKFNYPDAIGRFNKDSFISARFVFFFGKAKKCKVTALMRKRPDLDNLLKPIQDAISSNPIASKKKNKKTIKILGAGVIHDDSNIVILESIKYQIGWNDKRKPSIQIHLNEIPKRKTTLHHIGEKQLMLL